MDHGNTALRPPACDLRARRDERQSKHAACRGAAYVITRTADDVRPTGSEREWPFNWKHCRRLIDFDWQMVDNRKILLGINQEAHNSICRLQELMQLWVNCIMLWWVDLWYIVLGCCTPHEAYISLTGAWEAGPTWETTHIAGVQ